VIHQLRGADRETTGARLRRRYEAGDTIRGIAAATGRSYGATRDLLIQAGTTLRTRGARTR